MCIEKKAFFIEEAKTLETDAIPEILKGPYTAIIQASKKKMKLEEI